MFSIGDRVAHPMHGAGTIRKIVQQKIDGEKRNYFEIELLAGNMTILVPCDNGMGGIRKVVSPEEADAALKSLSAEQEDEDMSWNKRYRENIIKIKSGDLIHVAGVIKSLITRERDKGLSIGERKLLCSARQIIISEIAVVKGFSYEEAEKAVDEALA